MATRSTPFAVALAAARALHVDGRRIRGWYAGITNHPPTRLFDQHKVDQVGGQWAWAECASEDVARGAERHLLAAGYQGGPGGGRGSSVYVYVYKVTATTCEDC